jgi:DNA-binding MarR family transcriptional regulator
MASETVVKDVMDSIRRIVQALRSSHRAAGTMNLTAAQLFVISTLAEADGPLSVGELARRTRTDQSTVSVVVTRLVNKGLLKRQMSSADNRRVDVTLTAKGRTLQRKGPATVAQRRLADALERLAPREGAVLSRLLNGIVEEMGETDTPAEMLFEERVRAPRKKSKR